MSLTSGVLSLVSKTQTQVQLSATAASGGTGPYTYQWYRSTVSGFSPGGGNILAGKTSLSLTDTGVIPGTQYYYELVSTDTGNSNVTIGSAQLGVQTLVTAPGINQFAQSVVVGMIDLRFDYDTLAAQIDVSQVAPVYPGQCVKIVDSLDGVPKVVACSANSDDCFGVVNYNQKDASYLAGSAVEVSQAGNVVYMIATGAIARGVRVQMDISSVGGVGALAANGADILGYALDKAAAAGAVIRVKLSNPSFTKSA